MKAYRPLPEGYRETMQMNLQKDRKTAAKINIGGSVALVVLLVIGHFYVSAKELLHLDLARLVVMVAGLFLYLVLHELTHAAVMKAVGGGKVKFGFTGMYAFAGSEEDYFDKISYRCIALAPLVVWGIIFFVLVFTLPKEWFWVIWWLQAMNISGAAGDVYVTVKLWKKPDTTLIRDTGVDMTVYERA